MKRILSLVLALSMVLSMFSFAFAGTTLPDVAGTDYEAAVSALVELGIVNGYEDGTYRADKTVTRAEMAKFLVVSAGLEGAADVAKGATNFSDVPATHWATGYINVASQYGYINGYPEGTFAPDATVSYAEAVTMAIRVLGYKTVVEAKGTWPTNYIAKASELKVIENVKYGRYTDGATRGNVALLMWNMLTTPMWDVTGENENNGLNYEKVATNMIDKYFDDYTYVKATENRIVTDIAVLDGEVTIAIANGTPVEIAAGIDFLNLKGRTVSTLYSKEAEKFVMVVPSNDDRVVEGYRDELSGDKYVFSGESSKVWGTARTSDSDYVVAVLGTKKNVEYTTRYAVSAATIVEEIKVRNEEVRINGTDLVLDAEDIVLIDGEWATADDVEIGDIVTELVADELYIVSRDVVTGKFEAVTNEIDADETTYFVTVAGEKYSAVGNLKVVELDEDGEEFEGATLDAILASEADDENGKYYGEKVSLYLNFLGEIEKIAFGEVEENEVTGAFYVLTNTPKASWVVSDKNGDTTYIELNGESYEVKSGVAVPTTNTSGDVVYVEFDSKDRVKAIYSIPASGDAISGDFIVDKASGEAIYDEKAKTISGDKYIFRATAATTVVKITPVTTKEDKVETVEYYEVESSKGVADLEGVKYGVVVSESGDAFNKATYVFVWEDARNTEKTHGIVDRYTKSNGIVYLTIDGTKYAVDMDRITDSSFTKAPLNSNVENYVGRAVEFIDNEDGISITMSYGASEIAAAPVVGEVENGRAFIMSGDVTGTVIDLDTEAMEKALEDVKVFVINVYETEVDGEYAFDSFELVDYADIKVKVEDRIAIDPAGTTFATITNAETILIIRGFEA